MQTVALVEELSERDTAIGGGDSYCIQRVVKAMQTAAKHHTGYRGVRRRLRLGGMKHGVELRQSGG